LQQQEPADETAGDSTKSDITTKKPSDSEAPRKDTKKKDIFKPRSLDTSLQLVDIPFKTFAAVETPSPPTTTTTRRSPSPDTTNTSAPKPQPSISVALTEGSTTTTKPNTNLTSSPSHRSSSALSSPDKPTTTLASSKLGLPSSTNMSANVTPELDKKQKPFTDLLYDQLSNLFGQNEGSVLVVENPGRVLDEGTYFYDQGNPLYTNVTKPQVVKEEEFRLSDSLYDVDLHQRGAAHMVDGPNGSKLSVMYQEVLGTLVPKMDGIGMMYKDREKLRDWLLEEVKDTIDENDFVGSRMAFYTALTNRYLEAKRKWEDDRAKKLLEAKKTKDNEKLEEYLTWLAYNGPSKEAEIAALYNDLVVRGYYHEIRKVFGYIDVASPAEILEKCKENMRNSSMLSMDESETIYPVQMQPVSWAKSLRTDFEPIDLLLDPDNVRTQLDLKFEERDGLLEELSRLNDRPTGDVEKLQKEVDDAQDTVDGATNAMVNQFGEANFTAAQIAYNAYVNHESNKDVPDEELIDRLQHNDEPMISEKDFDTFKKYQQDAITNQSRLTSAGSKLVYALAMKAQAEATDTSDQVSLLRSQLTTLNRQIQSLKVVALSGKRGSVMRTGPKDLHPLSEPKAGNFMDVIVHSRTHEVAQDSELQSKSSSSGSSASNIFWSAGVGESDAESDFNEKFSSRTVQFDVGLRATKVTIDRGGWFDPEVLTASDSLFRTTPEKFNIKFPAYPMDFIIVKDITVHFTVAEEDREHFSTYAEKTTSSGGGFLCFGHHHSKTSKSSSQGLHIGITETGVIIRIPGSQIFMWNLHRTPRDKSAPYPTDKSALPDDTYVTDAEKDSKA